MYEVGVEGGLHHAEDNRECFSSQEVCVHCGYKLPVATTSPAKEVHCVRVATGQDTQFEMCQSASESPPHVERAETKGRKKQWTNFPNDRLHRFCKETQCEWMFADAGDEF